MHSLWPTTDGPSEILPGASLEETDEAFVFELDLPGVSKEDITIEVSSNRVSVKGDRKEPQRDGVVRRSTRVTGTFAYEVTMPAPIEGTDVTAAMTDGVLKITAPKAIAARPMHVSIG
jgi:HSP20 family protein